MAQKKKALKNPRKDVAGLSQLATGMPALDNVAETSDFVSPQGVKYKILKTSETDSYDPVPSPARPSRKRTG